VTDLLVTTAELNIEVNPGEPLEVTVPLLDGDGLPVEVGAAEDWSATCQVRADWRATDTLHEFAPTFTEGTSGAVVLSATAAETAAWQVAGWTVGQFDLFVVDTADTAHCVLAGEIRLVPRVTREDA
jgi:hypothetical protein